MRTAYFPRLAKDGILKNRRLYFPYLLACALMAAVFYIFEFLAGSSVVMAMHGGDTLTLILKLGSIVVFVFAAAFLVYGNSFILRRRSREFGLYRVLGMDRRGIRRVAFFETLFSGGVSLVTGLAAGIALSKFAEAVLVRLTDAQPDYAFSVPGAAVMKTAVCFAVIYSVLLVCTLVRVRRASDTELLLSERAGDRPPKAHLLPGLFGLVLLIAAYALSIRIQQPVEALLWFFVAVLMVIAATYLLFISGSVRVLGALAECKNYYYKPEHFLSVSSMRYRMKRNGAGLGSICILVTMVLVILSSTACLYFGKDAAVRARFPRNTCVDLYRYGFFESDAENLAAMERAVGAALPGGTVEKGSLMTYGEYCITGYLDGGKLDISLNSKTDMSFIRYDRVCEAHFISLSDYNRCRGTSETLEDGEALVCAVKADELGNTLTVGTETVKVKRRIDSEALEFDGSAENSVTAALFIVVNDIRPYARAFSGYADYNGDPMLLLRWHYRFDASLPERGAESVKKAVLEAVRSVPLETGEDRPNVNFSVEREEIGDFYASFGGLFFVGGLLSVVFLISAALIIYFKQVSEGYEDSGRFAIMRKVGLSKELIRKSVFGQMHTVFLLPVGAAVVHLAFAFPIVRKLLMLFGLFDKRLLILTAALSVLACLVIYLLICRFTLNAYTAIVTGAEEAD